METCQIQQAMKTPIQKINYMNKNNPDLKD